MVTGGWPVAFVGVLSNAENGTGGRVSLPLVDATANAAPARFLGVRPRALGLLPAATKGNDTYECAPSVNGK